MTYCYVCPHRCGVDRAETMNSPNGIFGSCGCGMQPIVARAATIVGRAMHKRHQRFRHCFF